MSDDPDPPAPDPVPVPGPATEQHPQLQPRPFTAPEPVAEVQHPLDPEHLAYLDLDAMSVEDLRRLTIRLALRHGNRPWPVEAWRVRQAYIHRRGR